MLGGNLIADTNLGVYQFYIFFFLLIILIIYGHDKFIKGSSNNIIKTIIGLILSFDFITFVILDFKNVFYSIYLFYIGNFKFIGNPPLVCLQEGFFSEIFCFIFAPQEPFYYFITRFFFFIFSLIPINYILSANITLVLFLIRKKTLGDLLHAPSWFWLLKLEAIGWGKEKVDI